jgi:hypothetical protein
MAKRKAFLHVGPTHSGTDFLDDALALHADALAGQRIRRPAKSADEMLRAALEIRRVHKSWGYKRREVEGAWNAVCRRAYKGKDTVVFSQPHLAAASHDEIALLLDQLPGFDLHVVLNVVAPLAPHGDQDVVATVGRWAAALRSPDRLHVIVPSTAVNAAAFTWTAFGRIVGFDATPLALPSTAKSGPTPPLPRHRYDELADLAVECGKAIAEGGYDVHGELADLLPARPGDDPTGTPSTEELLLASTRELSAALDGLERLRVRCAALEARNAELGRTGKKLKRRLTNAVTQSAR